MISNQEPLSVADTRLGGRTIGSRHPPFVIAEISGNHNGSLAKALAIVEAAARAGAHAVKIQTYTADTMTLDIREREFVIDDPESLWHGRSLYDLYQEAHTPWEWHPAIFARCRELGVPCFSTPFDETAVDYLEGLEAPFYKIASFENTDIPLIRRVARTGKPIIISTGMATVSDLDGAVHAAREAGCRDIVLLKCTSSYPASPAQSNLLTIPHLRELFGCHVGLSDHTRGVGVAVASVALGARVIEKHFTLDRSEGGVDAAFSLEPRELELLVQETERAFLALGSVQYGAHGDEVRSLQFRRSLYVVKDVEAGEVFSEENVRAIRPGLGLAPSFFDRIRGRRAARPVKRGTPFSWDLL